MNFHSDTPSVGFDLRDCLWMIAVNVVAHVAVALVIVTVLQELIFPGSLEMHEDLVQTLTLTILSATLISLPTGWIGYHLAIRLLADRQRHEIAAATDFLTRLPNRRAFEAAVRARLTRVHPGALMVLDVDHFKRINDTHGHSEGDRALAHIADVLRDSVRDGDVAGRIGGEEFGVLLTSGCRESAERVGERLRRRVEALDVRDSETGAPIRLTISIGISFFGPDGTTLETCYAQADQALYWAKDAGRNRVSLAA